MLRARVRAGLEGPVLLGFADDGDVDETLLAPFAPLLGSIATATAHHPDAGVLGGVGNGRLRRRLVDGEAGVAVVVGPIAGPRPASSMPSVSRLGNSERTRRAAAMARSPS